MQQQQPAVERTVAASRRREIRSPRRARDFLSDEQREGAFRLELPPRLIQTAISQNAVRAARLQVRLLETASAPFSLRNNNAGLGRRKNGSSTRRLEEGA